MSHLLGIDLGTQSLKAVLITDEGESLAAESVKYPLLIDSPGFAEQDPDRWWKAAATAVRRVLAKAKVEPADVQGLALSGQMHGTVLVDKTGRPLTRAVIWADARSKEEARRLQETIASLNLTSRILNPVAPGFQGATLLWFKKHRPRLLKRTAHVLLPKDFINLRLTGRAATEPSDAASTLLFDTRRRRWCEELIRELDFNPSWFSPVADSREIIGRVTPSAARATGLSPGTPVVAGGGDQPCMALGCGVIDPGEILLTIGTGGQLFTPLARPRGDRDLRTHTFCHLPADRWFIMGAMLSAGLSISWLVESVLGGCDLEKLSRRASRVERGSEGLLFLPYLIGERTPHMDPQARGVFFGLELGHRREHLFRAVMEGVTFAMRDSLEIFRKMKLPSRRLIFTGGASTSPVWRRIVAEVFAMPVEVVRGREHSARGAALLAGVGTGVFSDFRTAVRRAVRRRTAARPTGEGVECYRGFYELFRRLYPDLKGRFQELVELREKQS